MSLSCFIGAHWMSEFGKWMHTGGKQSQEWTDTWRSIRSLGRDFSPGTYHLEVFEQDVI